MAAINIQSLFADIIDTPEQRQQKLLQQGMLQGQLLSSGLRGRAAALAPLAQIGGQLGVQRNDALRRAVQPMIGIDPRSTGERVSEQLQGLDPENPDSLLQVAQALQSTDPVRAASLRQMAAQKRVEKTQLDRQKRIDDLKTQAAELDVAEGQSTRARRERSEAALPEIAERFRSEGFDDLASQIESNNITVEQANTRADARREVAGSENYARLSNTEIFNRADGSIISTGEIPPERIVELGEGNNKRIVGFDKNGEVKFNISAFELLNQTTAGSSNATDPNSELSDEYINLRANAATSFAAMRSNANTALAILEESPLAAGRVSNMTRAFTANLPTLQAGLMQSNIDLDGAISSIKANVAFDRLQKMRDESKTGGALGNVSNIELGLLESSIASLDSRIDPELLMQNIKRVERHYENLLNAEMGLPITIDLSDPIYEGRVVQRENGEIWVKDAKTNEWVAPKDQNTIIIKSL
jgi:hypothetical protein